MGSLPLPDSFLDPAYTDLVISAMGPNTKPRFRKLMTGLIRHIHDFARDNELTIDEWEAGMAVLNELGLMSNGPFNPMQILSEMFGLESIVEEITVKKLKGDSTPFTPKAVLGPFYQEGAPWRENGSSIVDKDAENGKKVYVYGRVLEGVTRKPVQDAVVNTWQSSTNGLYDVQDDAQSLGNLRGKFKTDAEGRYSFYCLKPTAYPVPDGNPIARMLDQMDRHKYRPAHIHIVVTHDTISPLVTQIYPRDDPYLRDDVAFAVVNNLVKDFSPRKNDPKAELELEFDLMVQPAEEGHGFYSQIR